IEKLLPASFEPIRTNKSAGKIRVKPVSLKQSVRILLLPAMNESLPKTVLFVEDDLVVMTAYRNRLQQAGYHVETAADGVEAMKHLMLLTPDVIMLDLMLPKVNGVDVMKFIRKTPRLQKTPVIVLSTNSIIDGKSDSILE